MGPGSIFDLFLSDFAGFPLGASRRNAKPRSLAVKTLLYRVINPDGVRRNYGPVPLWAFDQV